MTNEEAINLIIRNGDVFRYDEQMKQALTLAIIALRCSYKRPQGEWIKDEHGIERCSKCFHRCMEFVMGKPKDNFCIECGADMRKGGAEE